MKSIKKYYTCKPHMEKVYERKKQKNKMEATNIDEYISWKNDTRKVLTNLIGLDKMEKVDLKPEILEKVEIGDGIVREKVIIQVEEDVYMPMYILIPQKANIEGGKSKCYIALAGHQGAGKYSVAGCREIPVVNKMIDYYNYDYGLQMAKRGYVTICPDPRGFGERREEELQNDDDESFLNSTCFQLAHMAEPFGMTVIGMCVWDTQRLLDYIIWRDEWNVENIGCIGFSGGGMQALWTSALDERINEIIISGYMYGYKDSLLKLCGNCSCNYIPNLWEYADMGDIGALLAPRKLMLQSCREDHLNGYRGLENVFEQVKIIKKAYAIYEKEDKIFHDICEGGHKWHDENLDYFLDNKYFRKL